MDVDEFMEHGFAGLLEGDDSSDGEDSEGDDDDLLAEQLAKEIAEQEEEEEEDDAAESEDSASEAEDEDEVCSSFCIVFCFGFMPSFGAFWEQPPCFFSMKLTQPPCVRSCCLPLT